MKKYAFEISIPFIAARSTSAVPDSTWARMLPSPKNESTYTTSIPVASVNGVRHDAVMCSLVEPAKKPIETSGSSSETNIVVLVAPGWVVVVTAAVVVDFA